MHSRLAGLESAASALTGASDYLPRIIDSGRCGIVGRADRSLAAITSPLSACCAGLDCAEGDQMHRDRRECGGGQEWTSFSVLGPVEIRRDGRALSFPGSKLRLLLAILLARAGQVVATDAIIEALWHARPPRSAVDNLRGYVYQLRRILRDADRVVRQSGGYVVVVRQGELDAGNFEELAARGLDLLARGAPEEAGEALTRALALWRGRAFADLADAQIVGGEAARLQERRIAVLGACIDAYLAVGRHADVVAELSVLAADHPLHERFRAQLMLALYRSGRRAEALQVYRETRRILRDELGLEPGPGLRHLERAMLAADESLNLADGVLPAHRPWGHPRRVQPPYSRRHSFRPMSEPSRGGV